MKLHLLKIIVALLAGVYSISQARGDECDLTKAFQTSAQLTLKRLLNLGHDSIGTTNSVGLRDILNRLDSSDESYAILYKGTYSFLKPVGATRFTAFAVRNSRTIWVNCKAQLSEEQIALTAIHELLRVTKTFDEAGHLSIAIFFLTTELDRLGLSPNYRALVEWTFLYALSSRFDVQGQENIAKMENRKVQSLKENQQLSLLRRGGTLVGGGGDGDLLWFKFRVIENIILRLRTEQIGWSARTEIFRTLWIAMMSQIELDDHLTETHFGKADLRNMSVEQIRVPRASSHSRQVIGDVGWYLLSITTPGIDTLFPMLERSCQWDVWGFPKNLEQLHPAARRDWIAYSKLHLEQCGS